MVLGRTKERQNRAHAAYEELVSLGGRPTRPVRPKPVYKTTLEGDLLTWFDEEKGETCRCEPQIFISGHWLDEANKFEQELNDWKEFKSYQEEVRRDVHIHLWQEYPPAEEFDQSVQEYLVGLRSWRGYRHYLMREHSSNLKDLDKKRLTLRRWRARLVSFTLCE